MQEFGLDDRPLLRIKDKKLVLFISLPSWMRAFFIGSQ